jgi:integrase/recombinase XerD
MKYKFNQEIKNQLKSFETHLKELGYGKDSIRQKTNYLGCFLNWLENERLKPENVRFNDLLNFIESCFAQFDTKKLINSKLRSIRNYYEYLKTENENIINPAANLHLKGEPRKIISGVIEFKELETLYQSYPPGGGLKKSETLREKRNKVILGLLIYQGITTEELKQLEPGHLKLKEGKIYIPGNRRRNSRTLELKPFQILELNEYVNETRPAIIKQIGEPTPCRKPNKIEHEKINNQLFISINGSENIKNSLLHLFKDVQKISKAITNAQQIRQSTITYWLKNHNLRQVQYMAGHKYVSSTERYQMDNLESLKDKVEKYHPLNKTNHL